METGFLPKTTGGKRGPQAPLVVTTSDEEEGDTDARTISFPDPTPNRSRGGKVKPAALQILEISDRKQHEIHACEHDHDYENIASPDNSSTASGPTYERQPGFTYHAHSVVKTKSKKKKCALLSIRDGLKRRDPTPPKIRPKRDPLPMKLRALPQSFWQQPNIPHQVSPGNLFPVLPPLSRDTEEVMDVRPITPPEDKDRTKKQTVPSLPDRKVSQANPDLLLRLFDVIESHHGDASQKRGRPRKTHKKITNKSMLCGDDPYMVEAVSEKYFPQLTIDGRTVFSGNTTLQLITMRNGDKMVNLPALASEQNYSQMLSELVTHI